ncbi:MAG: aromatic hydrocarbon degradation protein [Candidatus Symbiothrix sp.]|jgi:long-chain fatty acid transport protein|nr:aromatic hydrocarbon degradation protein [Candidatus Symbiothrix sp.]
MNKMMGAYGIRLTVVAVATVVNLSAVFAGGLLTNTNQSAHFARMMAREASTEIDAVYTNPAGLSWLPTDGFHFSITNQSAFQTRTITSTLPSFAGFGGDVTKAFEGKASAPIIPSIQAAYKTGDWVLSGSFAVTGGGGKATFNKGLPSFEAPISALPNGVNQLGLALGALMPGTTLTAGQYSVNAYMEGSSFIYGAQLGGTYAISEHFSGYAGFRMNFVSNGYVGHLTAIQINPTSNVPALGTGVMVPASAYFNGLAQLPQLQDPSVVNYKNQLLGLSASTADKYVDCSQSGWGITPVIGVNFNYNQLNIGLKYEFNTHLNVENKTKIDDTNSFPDGVNTPNDVPALFTAGVSYKICPQLTASLGYHHFFDSDSKMANDKEQYAGSTNEYLVGVEYKITDMFLISGGGQITHYGVGDDYQRDLSFVCSSYSLGFGGAVNVSEKVRINAGYFWSTYSDYTVDAPDAAGGKLTANNTLKDVYSRTNKVFAVGVDFSF